VRSPETEDVLKGPGAVVQIAAGVADAMAHALLLTLGKKYGYALANAGHDTRALQAWLGHKNIQHTVRYTELAPDRFKDFWR
jgi:site-specific recombinase XerD